MEWAAAAPQKQKGNIARRPSTHAPNLGGRQIPITSPVYIYRYASSLHALPDVWQNVFQAQYLSFANDFHRSSIDGCHTDPCTRLRHSSSVGREADAAESSEVQALSHVRLPAGLPTVLCARYAFRLPSQQVPCRPIDAP